MAVSRERRSIGRSTGSMIRIGILDQSPVREGGTPADAIRETVELARSADRWGYHRYWLAEHHSTPALAGASPEIMVTQVAAVTRRIRVGSGGVMLSNYSALKVAEQFRMLEALHPGRIDLGVGQAPGADERTAQLLRLGAARRRRSFARQLEDLLAFLRDDLPSAHPGWGVHAMPSGPGAPELWLLGSSRHSARMAARLGLPFSFAHFINADGGAEAARAYRREFRPSAGLAAPRSSVAVFAICARTEAGARRLARSRELFVARLNAGRAAPYPTLEEARAHLYTAQEAAVLRKSSHLRVVGTAPQVRRQLLAIADDYQADELVIVTITHDVEDRLRSYELLAGAFGLT
jgi:luciferase family oxidoreductase group 1